MRAVQQQVAGKGQASTPWKKELHPLQWSMRLDIVKAHHDYLIVGHPGQWKTTELATHKFWWPRMGCYVADYMKGCDLCNPKKTYPTPLYRKLMPNQVLDCQWQDISVDLIMELQPSQGYDAIMVVVDHLSKRAHVILTTSDVMASGVAQLFRDHRWKLHGLPEEVISN